MMFTPGQRVSIKRDLYNTNLNLDAVLVSYKIQDGDKVWIVKVKSPYNQGYFDSVAWEWMFN